MGIEEWFTLAKPQDEESCIDLSILPTTSLEAPTENWQLTSTKID
jgi:hypothetical protein